MNDCQEDRQMARATARVARTIHGDVEHGQCGIVRATLAVALASRNNELDIRECFCYDEHREKSTV